MKKSEKRAFYSLLSRVSYVRMILLGKTRLFLNEKSN